MSDQLKSYIEQNKEQFDAFPFDETKGWSELSFRKKKFFSFYQWSMLAAMSMTIVFVGMILLKQFTVDENTIPLELAEADAYYSEKISQRMFAIKKYGAIENVEPDLAALDQIFEELKNDLKEDARNEEVVQAMIETYRFKLLILERILENMEMEKNVEINQL